jgi:tetratricopeptide (TPR) repeat protein
VAVIDDAERAFGQGQAALASLDVDAAVAHLSAAVRGFAAAEDRRRGAMACAALGDVLANAVGNLTAGRAWFARASRLVEDEPPCIEQGWVAVAAMGCDVADPAALLAHAELALDRARRFGDVNLEAKAMADAGLAQVQAGRVAEGMALLDEAMALVCGPADDIGVAGKSVCSFFTACYYTADFARVDDWTATLRGRGLLGAAPGPPLFLSTHCDSVQATLLCELGHWGDAEVLLDRAIVEFESAMHIRSWHPAIALADLRIRQGRLTDAEMLLLGKDDHPEALLPSARLHLARGDHDMARAMARRGLRTMGADRLRASELLAVLVDAELAAGDVDAAVAAAADLDERTRSTGIAVLAARSAAVQARVLAAAGDLAAAVAAVHDAVAELDPRRAPCLRALLLIELARLYDDAGDRVAAQVEAKAAAAVLAPLDVALPARDQALFRDLGIDVGCGGRNGAVTATLVRERRGWTAECAGERVRLADTKGMRYLAELVAAPGLERHALDLVDRVEGVDTGDGAVDRRGIGDAGEVLDGRARSHYRRRIEELRSLVEDALAVGHGERAEALQDELDQLVAHLAQAFGLGGRSRRSASAAERARLNVTRALRTATGKVADALPHAGAALDRRIRTGLYCAYEPEDHDDVRWIVHS